jgi:hypothetical protein
MTYTKPAPTLIPTEPIGSIPRPIDLLQTIVSFRRACVDEPGAPGLAPRGHNCDAFFSPKIEPLAFFLHAVSG